MRRGPRPTTPEGRAQLDDLVTRAVRGEEAAFADLFLALQPRVLRYLRARVGEASYEDVAAETWLHVARDIGRFRGDADAFAAWVFTVARSRATDAFRRAAARPMTVSDQTHGARDPVASAEQEALDRMQWSDLIAAIGRLPTDQGEAVRLRVLAGLDVATTAQLLGKSKEAVRVNTHRGLRRLAETFQPVVVEVA